MKTFYLPVLLLFACSFCKLQAQCDIVETIAICDMTTIDGNTDGTPDGIINLYDQYNALPGVTPISPSDGAWYDPNFNFALDETTGDLYLWDLDDASVLSTDYQFQFINTNSLCPDGIVSTLNVILGPFSGFARPVLNIDDVNLEVCDMGSTPQELCTSLPDVDIFEALESLPSPHLNGEWIYNGSSPNFVSISGSYLTVTIPYNSGPPLVDQETFELTYRISGIPPCDVTLETTVNVSVTRQVFSGYGQAKRICELDILNGAYDGDVDLSDDAFLLLEDLEGLWSTGDPYGQIISPNDSSININNIYQQIIADNGIRFGCAEFDYTYSVDQRSGVCGNAKSDVSFKIYEYLRPFTGGDPLEFCQESSTLPATINLYDQIEFATEDGILFDYNSDEYTNWKLVSGPSTLGLLSIDDPNYTALGTINIQNGAPGNYVFEYTVSQEVNCPGDQFTGFAYDPNTCTPIITTGGLCNSQTAQVSLTIYPKLYAGEDTLGLEFCETDPAIAAPLDLFTLLGTNGVDDPIYQGTRGTWIDGATGNIISNPITLPEVSDQQIFDFLYTTTSVNNCFDRASLSFTVYEEYQSGITGAIDVCNTNSPFNLFDRLTGDPNTTGTWTGPNGYTTTDHNAIFNPASSEDGQYTYTVPDNVLCIGNQASITVTLYQSTSAGNDMSASVCRSDLQIDLTNYLDASADSGGTFVDSDSTNQLTGTLLDVSQLSSGTYNFQYEIQGHISCDLATAQISITVDEVLPPSASNQTFCASDGATISDLVASNGADYNWYDDANTITSLSFSTVLINGEDYFVAALDSNNCESSRVSITVTLLPIDHVDCDTCLKDGVSPNNDGENDVFDLCNLPVAFPNFEINIYNRYDSLVYKGNQNTALFKGESNVALSIGKDLPSGVYFYVFDPKDGVTEPIQGNFYLSR
ncbi:MAG: gliding motility-associated C-terminal domain-containing protein [Algibacter sp.]